MKITALDPIKNQLQPLKPMKLCSRNHIIIIIIIIIIRVIIIKIRIIIVITIIEMMNSDFLN